MGDSAIWFYPGGDGHLVKVSIDRDTIGISDLQLNPVIVAGQATSIHGATSTSVSGGYDEILLSVANFKGDALRRQLAALDMHLRAGFAISFALDEDLAWGAFALSTVPQDSTSIVTSGNTWPYNASAVLSADDEVLVRSPPPQVYRREEMVIDSVTGPTSGTLNFDSGTLFPRDHTPVLVTERFFFPVLRFAGDPSQTLLTSDRHWSYSFTAPLRLDWVGLSAFYASTGQGASPDVLDVALTQSRQPHATLDDLLVPHTDGSRFQGRTGGNR